VGAVVHDEGRAVWHELLQAPRFVRRRQNLVVAGRDHECGRGEGSQTVRRRAIELVEELQPRQHRLLRYVFQDSVEDTLLGRDAVPVEHEGLQDNASEVEQRLREQVEEREGRGGELVEPER